MLTARLILSNNMRINLNISDMHMTLVCPGIRQRAPFSALIKPIGLCGTQNAQKNFRTRPKIFGPPYRTEVPMAD